jgi:nitroimidazol reductase NimA-like FMN-containing flavoprotein (pyridoxamine 5'-phosphate oxidase superfamily)
METRQQPHDETSSERFEPTQRTTLVRRSHRGSHQRAEAYAVIDEALYCHVALEVNGHPIALATAHARIGQRLYLHGARSNRMFGAIARGDQVCVTFTLLDGLVFAYSAFSHSMNFRSVVVLGRGSEVTDVDEKRRALSALIEHMAPGRMAEIRPPAAAELASTLVVSLPIEEASLKRRSGPPLDQPTPEGPTGTWVGVLPLRFRPGPAEASGLSSPPSAAVLARTALMTK